ncbi:NAD(P)-binding protein [Artomyces pyxidatus]|uniref:NAD(P)-binding protein n=1 Tax=Artomyces pyxidatus TaxID=48021 RepID=A0ACB8T105_9AGAM|nr:NAD(P)-binding protein [Artomyces pyxidatus]
MPGVTSGTVLVTGGTGYVGAWIVKFLVAHGFHVLAAVRTEKQGEFLVNRFPEYEGKVAYTLVPDIQKDGAYDDAVKDVDAIIHAASPVIFKWKDPNEVIGPAVNGSTGILKSAHAYGHVKRVLITSSVAAIHGFGLDRQYSEADWNTEALEAKHDSNSSPWLVYDTAKSKAEKAAWDFVKDNKVGFDLVTILPAFNWGPYIHQPVAKTFGSSPSAFLDTLPDGDTSGTAIGDWVDVRDSALLHVLSLEKEEIGGERLINTNGTFAWQDLYDPLIEAGYDVPGKSTKGAGANKSIQAIFPNDKTFKYFPDFKYRGLKESVLDMAADFKKGGYLN